MRQPLHDIGRNLSMALLRLIDGQVAPTLLPAPRMPALELVVRETKRRMR